MRTIEYLVVAAIGLGFALWVAVTAYTAINSAFERAASAIEQSH